MEKLTSDYRFAVAHNHAFDLIEESNRIEGIKRNATDPERRAFVSLVCAKNATLGSLGAFLTFTEPSAKLRNMVGRDVRVGNHRPPPGGLEIQEDLRLLLEKLPHGLTPYEAHIAFEKLHPYTDGNGRTGRALWHWHMLKLGDRDGARLGFLHEFYYQSLEAAGDNYEL